MVSIADSCSWIAFLGMEPSQKWLVYIKNLPLWAVAGLLLSLLLILIALIIKLRDLPSNLRARNKSTLDPTQLEELMLGTPPQIVDLRPKAAYLGEKGHIRGAVNIPFSEFKKRIEELDTSYPRPIVLVDESDALSHQLLPYLVEHGHRWIYVLKGGFKAWRRAKNPVYIARSEQKPK